MVARPANRPQFSIMHRSLLWQYPYHSAQAHFKPFGSTQTGSTQTGSTQIGSTQNWVDTKLGRESETGQTFPVLKFRTLQSWFIRRRLDRWKRSRLHVASIRFGRAQREFRLDCIGIARRRWDDITHAVCVRQWPICPATTANSCRAMRQSLAWQPVALRMIRLLELSPHNLTKVN